MQKILELSEGLKSELIEIRRHLHENPETGFDLKETSNYVIAKLEEMGYSPKRIGRSGVVATIGREDSGKTFLLRADLDALPIKEETEHTFKSLNGNMHACGHDFHTTMLLGACKILKEIEESIEGCIKVMFQPAEELLEGAKSMIEDGILENPKVDAALMIHISTGMPGKTGDIIILDSDVITASHDRFDINIKGSGCHGAMPSVGVDPLIALSNIHLGLQSINSREISADDSLVVTVGSITGGSAANIIPETAKMCGTIRSFDDEIRKFSKRRIKEISESIGTAYRCDVDVKFSADCPSFLNDNELNSFTRKKLNNLFPKDVLDVSNLNFKRVMGSEDFSFISREVPSTSIFIGAEDPNSEVYPMHHPKVSFDESILTKGSAIYSYISTEWLKNNK